MAEIPAGGSAYTGRLLRLLVGATMLLGTPQGTVAQNRHARTACPGELQFQVDVRTGRGEPLGGLTGHDLALADERLGLQIRSVHSFSSLKPDDRVVSLLVIVWPYADFDQHAARELMASIRRQDSVKWQVTVLGPAAVEAPWGDSLDRAAERLLAYTAAVERQNGARAFSLSDPALRPWLAQWPETVGRAVQQLISQPGRRILLELTPRPSPSLVSFFPGESRVAASARLGEIPVYRIRRSVLSGSALMPFGDASSGPPLAPDANISPAQVGALQLEQMRGGPDIPFERGNIPEIATDDLRRHQFASTGGGDVFTPAEFVSRATRDAAGSYFVDFAPPRSCSPSQLLPIGLKLRSEPRQKPVRIFAPNYLLPYLAAPRF